MNKIKKIMYMLTKEYKISDYIGDINLNLGCGKKRMAGFVNIDFYNKECADMILDLNSKLPFESETVDLVYADNVFEHIKNFLGLIKECHRVLKKDGVMVLRVPYFKSKHAFVDPTHVNYFTIQSMDYFVRGKHFYNEYKFYEESFEKIEIYLDPNSSSVFKKMISILAVKSPNWFENSIWANIFIFHNIIFVLRR